jgi:hypothetical protein
MADFTKIDQRVAAALSAEETHLAQCLAEIAPKGMQLELGPCGRVVDQIARTVFDDAIEAAAEDPELATEKRLRPFLRQLLRPHLIEALVGERNRTAVFDQTRVERNRVLDDHSLIGAGNRERFVAGPTSDSWKVAPAAVQVVFEPIGLYERLAPPSCRYLMRGNAALARQILGQLFDGAMERFLARLLAAGGMMAEALEQEVVYPRRRRGRPEEVPDLRKVAALAVLNQGKSNREAAKALHATKNPTAKQVSNLPSIMNNFKKKMARGATAARE